VGVGERAETGRNSKKSKNVQSEVNVSAVGAKNDGKGGWRREEDQELLVHGFASWCPHQLDREIRAGV
jgi:putative AlgH/UPF0301 family transcriptional regulator